MSQETVFAQLEANIHRLGEAKRDLESLLEKQKSELSSLYAINKEMQKQIDDLTETLQHQSTAPTMAVSSSESDSEGKQQRIHELVKEIDECIALLKQ